MKARKSEEGNDKKKKKESTTPAVPRQAVTHPSTEQAQRCLTLVIGQELVFSTWYGHRQLHIYSPPF